MVEKYFENIFFSAIDAKLKLNEYFGTKDTILPKL
jgi:hypothetical protein